MTVSVTRYDVRYRTNIHYDDVVRASQNEMRACPASDEHQQLVAYRVTTHPRRGCCRTRTTSAPGSTPSACGSRTWRWRSRRRPLSRRCRGRS